MRTLILAALLLLVPSAARAEWLQASSPNFVVYADDSMRDITVFSDRLERYHSAMEFITSTKLATASPSNRVTVYIVRSEREVRSLYGEGSAYIGGFYIPRAGGSLAIVPRVSTSGEEPAMSMIALLHEYAHHFLISTSNFPMPRWMSEGEAEFMAAASFGADGSVGIGRPANHRAAELLLPEFAVAVTVTDLLDPASYEKRNIRGYDSFYGKSWLLYHYLAFDKARSGQLDKYTKLLVQGKSSREAGLEAFGDFRVLESDVRKYLGQRRMMNLKLPADLVPSRPVTVRRLSAGEAAIMPVRIRSRRGVSSEEAQLIVTEARKVAAKYPDDPAVLSALSEAEHDADNDREAVAAADAALARDPTQVNAYVQKGLALMQIAEDTDSAGQAAAFKAAHAPFLKLNHLENDHPLPLIYNYLIALQEGVVPGAVALRGLERAVEIAPFDLGTRMTLAIQQLRFGKREQARRNLIPIAYNPHGDELAEAAKRVLARMESDPTWDGSGAPDADSIDGGKKDASR